MENLEEYIKKIPIVSDLLNLAEQSKIKPLLDAYFKDFITAPAAAKMHHNFTHGLVIHTAEVWSTAKLFIAHAPRGLEYFKDFKKPSDLHDDYFSIDELFVAIFLHDFAKIRQYEPVENFAWNRKKMICNQENWTQNELAKLGIGLTDNELVGLLHAEGGYTEFDVEWRPMSVIVHAADLWSSQAICQNWNPTDAAGVKCIKCGSSMIQRSGTNGVFYGCSKYPACRGTMNGNEVPSVDGIFSEWIKKNYPSDAPAPILKT